MLEYEMDSVARFQEGMEGLTPLGLKPDRGHGSVN
jgi:hypothetical protein